ncbi:hypothetical protein HMPREF3213_03267 [Heyndrickxia coagulans]|uniref:Uncharacterized protein n=1 Tax=Heyndrickxia coagulans TaxID=1398 RepID=A0A133KCY1_HEYCO|nr:hypothetical protein HMPREF3213_03267 [Heyndrickxia coagulans]
MCKVKIFDDFPSAQPDSCGEIMKTPPIKRKICMRPVRFFIVLLAFLNIC